MLAGVRFARGTARLLPGSDRALSQVAGAMGRWPELRLVVEGHTARGGSRARAIALSEQRAETVAVRLASMGVLASRISSNGRGFDAPIASNKSAAGRARNERIELRLVAP
ncbi:MAG: OmpA family protein [Myxococcota bacterium]